MLNRVKSLWFNGPRDRRLAMGNPETRALYDRSDLRFSSDLTDAEWECLAPLIPPGNPEAGVVKLIFVPSSPGFCMFWRTAASGAACPTAAHHAAQSTAIFSFGRGTARWSASITSSRFGPVATRAARPAQAPRSWTVNRSDPLKKGVHPDPVGYDAGKKIK